MSNQPQPQPEVRQGYILAPHEVESLNQALGAHQQVLGASDAFMAANEGASPVSLPHLRVNRKKLSDQALQIKRVLDAHAPRELDGAEKDKLSKRAQVLEARFRPFLETREELNVMKRDKAAWQSALKKAQMRPRYEADIQEWKAIKRLLNPGDPEADNLHNLRKERE